jgi:hypothetical protein
MAAPWPAPAHHHQRLADVRPPDSHPRRRLPGYGAKSAGNDYQHRGPVTANGRLRAIALQPTGEILIAGGFGLVNDRRADRVARLLANGELDPEFRVRLSPDSTDVSALALQDNGNLVIGGSFDSPAGVARTNLARIYLQSSDDRLRLDIPRRVENTLQFSLQTVSGRQYVAEFAASIAEDAWTPVSQLTGSGTRQTVTVPMEPAANRFYRVREE